MARLQDAGQPGVRKTHFVILAPLPPEPKRDAVFLECHVSST